MPIGLPSDLNFAPKNAVPRGVRSYRNNLSTIGGIPSAGLTDYLKFDIPTGRYGTYLDTSASYLQFKVTAGATGDLYIDGSAFAFFQRFTVLSGGQTLEDISCYNAFANMLIDAQVSPAVRQCSGNVHMGCGSDAGTNQLNILRQGVTIAAGTSQVFCLPLVSGFFANLGKYLPVGAIQNDLRLEIQLENQNNAVINVTTNGTGWSVTEANLMLTFVELEGEVQKMIDASTGGKYTISSETWRWYGNTVSGTGSQDNLLIPARYSSVKGLIGCYRPAYAQNNFIYAAQSHRVNPFYHASNSCSLQFAIGSQLYPNAPMRSAAEVFTEVQRYFHSLGSTDVRGCITQNNWNVISDAVTTNVYPLVVGTSSAANVASHFNTLGTGIFAINLDSVSNRSDVMSSGVSTLNQNITMNATYPSTYTTANANKQLRVDVWAHLDMILAIENGIITVQI